MKSTKLLLLISLLIYCSVVQAQKAEVGLTGGFGTTWLLNKNVFDRGPELDVAISGGGNYGVAASFYFTEKVGLGFEISNSIINQKYKGKIDEFRTFESKAKMTYLDLPILLKLKSGKSGFYFEIGPKLSYLFTANETQKVLYDYKGSKSTSSSAANTKSDFRNTIISGVIGIGGRINVADAVTVSIGVRFSGSITDATSAYNSGLFVYGTGTTSQGANYNSSGDLEYRRTTLASGGLQFGVLYRIGK